MIQRCQWVQGKPDYYLDYHDQVWGKPEYDDSQLFKWLVLETFHVGLSWQLVLSKYNHFMAAFDQMDYGEIASYSSSKIEELKQNEGIIRHQGKIQATITNAQCFMAVQEEWGSFSQYIWNFTQGQVVDRQEGPMAKQSVLSDQVNKDMKKRGFKFIGSITIYSYLQAIGIINDHDPTCSFKYETSSLYQV
ncbi:DNA-3-methyladenine glycosylase I [Hutsoniella sourekii]|uniref:DNA-3-methyladenine glycosylase I n=1 Tax=Hutsoniella sourekii TaxID=87650 RepID=UPI00047F84FF|nr:DNA-3-methyladenine glycosylase I [Hutsoniella sourekii]